MDFFRKLVFTPGILFDEIFSKTNYWRFSGLIFFLIAFLGGLIAAIDTHDALFSEPNLIGFIGLMAVIVIIIWIFVQYIFVWIFLIFGKVIGGKANMRQMMSVVAIGFIPNLVVVVYQLAYLLVIKNIGAEYNAPWIISSIIWLISIRILVVGISKSNQFSYGMAILNVFFVALLFQVIVMLFRY